MDVNAAALRGGRLSPQPPESEDGSIRLVDEAFSEPALRRWLGPDGAAVAPEHWMRALHGPVRDFLSRPGKRFRGRLVELAYGAAGGAGSAPAALSHLVETLHAGSLVVDDIEDEAVERRGAPALHRVYGMERALNAGNWMYFWPAALAGESHLAPALELEVYRRMHRTLLRCHYGQALDLSLRVGDLTQAELPGAVRSTTRLKTGSLLEFAAELGALAAEASPEVVEALGRFGSDIGTGLQMLDDLSGVAGGKRREKAREDMEHGRPTWVWAWAAERLTPDDFAALQEEARRVESGRECIEALRAALADRVAEYGRRAACELLGSAQARIRMHLGASEAMDALRNETARLEASYE